MKGYEEKQFLAALGKIGIRSADVLLVHSALFALGPLRGVAPRATPSVLYQLLRQCIGSNGTVVVPTFNFDFCDGATFDRQHTASKGMGVFAEAVRMLPEAQRSRHPMQSVAAVGPMATQLAEADTPSAFALGGPFDILLQADAKLLLLGASMNASSLIHYVEERAEVPYRYWKTFTGPVIDNGKRSTLSYRMYVRDLDLDPRLSAPKLTEALVAARKLRRQPLGNGWLQACSCRDFVDTALHHIGQDPYWLLETPPVEGTRPDVR